MRREINDHVCVCVRGGGGLGSGYGIRATVLCWVAQNAGSANWGRSCNCQRGAHSDLGEGPGVLVGQGGDSQINCHTFKAINCDRRRGLISRSLRNWWAVTRVEVGKFRG